MPTTTVAKKRATGKPNAPLVLGYADVFPDPEPDDLPATTNNPRYKLFTAASVRVKDTATGETTDLFAYTNRQTPAARKKKNQHHVVVEYAGPDQFRRLAWIVSVMKGDPR